MTVLREVHRADCSCSYCGQGPFGVRPMRYGLNVPTGWRKFNAWWVIKYGPGRYLRWTMPRFLFPARPSLSKSGAADGGASSATPGNSGTTAISHALSRSEGSRDE